MSLVRHGPVGATTMHRLSLERVERATGVIDPVFLRTPQFICEPLGDELGVRLALIIETLNPIRSFKGRGDDLLVSQVSPGTPLVCASAGNFGQAMAYASRKRGVPPTVYAALTATVAVLFELMNYIVEQMITRPKQINTMFNSIPPDKLSGIEKRDKK
jgi:threonine dehydratase